MSSLNRARSSVGSEHLVYTYIVINILQIKPDSTLQRVFKRMAEQQKEIKKAETKVFKLRPETEPLNYQGEAWYDADGNLLDPKDRTGFIG